LLEDAGNLWADARLLEGWLNSGRYVLRHLPGVLNPADAGTKQASKSLRQRKLLGWLMTQGEKAAETEEELLMRQEFVALLAKWRRGALALVERADSVGGGEGRLPPLGGMAALINFVSENGARRLG
jgi:hypothetical protein